MRNYQGVRRINNYSLFIAFWMLSGFVLAQNSMTGISVGFLQSNAIAKSGYYEKVKDSPASGYAFSIFRGYHLSENWLIEPGLSFTLSSHNEFLHLPIIARYKLGQKVSFLIGPSVSKMFGFPYTPLYWYVTNYQKSNALHANIGLRVDIGKNFFVESVYHHQLNDQGRIDGSVLKTNLWTLNFGTYFSSKRADDTRIKWLNPSVVIGGVLRVQNRITRDYLYREEKMSTLNGGGAIGVILGVPIHQNWSIQPEIHLQPGGSKYNPLMSTTSILLIKYALIEPVSITLGSYYDTSRQVTELPSSYRPRTSTQITSGPIMGVSLAANEDIYIDARYGFQMWTNRQEVSTKFSSSIVMILFGYNL
jgi:hypothetical protein